jgi:hypothetical protein
VMAAALVARILFDLISSPPTVTVEVTDVLTVLAAVEIGWPTS